MEKQWLTALEFLNWGGGASQGQDLRLGRGGGDGDKQKQNDIDKKVFTSRLTKFITQPRQAGEKFCHSWLVTFDLNKKYNSGGGGGGAKAIPPS